MVAIAQLLLPAMLPVRRRPSHRLQPPPRMIMRLPSVRIQTNRSSTCSKARPIPSRTTPPFLTLRIQSKRFSTRPKARRPRRRQICRTRRAHIHPRVSLTCRRPVSRATVRLRGQRLLRRFPPLSPLPRRHRRPTLARIRRNPSSIFSRASPLRNRRCAARANPAAISRARSASNQIHFSVWNSEAGRCGCEPARSAAELAGLPAYSSNREI